MPSSGCRPAAPPIITPFESSKVMGYESDKLKMFPESSVLGVGCGNRSRFADILEGDTVVDLGTGAEIDVFLAANIVGKNGKVIGVDMTSDMLKKGREIAEKHGYKNI